MGNIEPEDRKTPISIGLPAAQWKRIDEFIEKNGLKISRSQFIERISKWYMEEREKGQNSASSDVFATRQISTYFEDLEAYLRLSDIEEVRKVLPFIRHANQLAQDLTRKVKRDISKITDRDPTEKIRLENTRKAHEYREKHEKATENDMIPTPDTDTKEIELKRLAEDTGNEISERFKIKQQEEQQKPDIEIIEEEAPNPYSKGETVFK